MDANVEKLVDMLIQERMQSQYTEWRALESGEAEKANYLRMELEYEKAIGALSEEDCETVKPIAILSSIPAQRVRYSSTSWASKTAFDSGDS